MRFFKRYFDQSVHKFDGRKMKNNNNRAHFVIEFQHLDLSLYIEFVLLQYDFIKFME